ncbi:SMI1/KNR4 family protein [Streptomyces sp. NPDC001739]
MTDLSVLTRLCPPPTSPPSPADWPSVEAALGRALPADYKRLIDTYGSGSFWDFLRIFRPHAPTEWVDITGPMPTVIRGQLEEDRAQQKNPVPYDPQHLFAMGVTDNGEYLFWVTDPEDSPDQWTIAVNEARGPRWFTYDGTLTQFLITLLAKTTNVLMFPDDLQTLAPFFQPDP